MASVTENAATRTLVNQLAHDLTSGVSVLLAGLPKSGRSHLARLVAAELAQLRASVVVVRGNRMLAERPLAALTLADAKVDASLRATGGSAFAQTAESFAGLFDRPNSVLVVDDAAELDHLSVGVIVDARAKKRMSLLLVGNFDVYQDDLLTTLVAAAQPGVTIPLPGMPLEDVTQMVNTLLGETVASDTISQIAILSGGLPGLVEDIVQLSRRNKRLARGNGVWSATDDLWDPALQFSLLPLTRGLDATGLSSLTRLAQSEGITRSEAGDLVGTDWVDKLARQGVLRVDEGSSIAGVHVFPVALAELLRRGRGTMNPTASCGQPMAASWGRWPAHPTRLDATAIANRVRTNWRADVDRHWTRWNDDPTTSTAVPLLHALYSEGAHDDRIGLVLAKTRRSPDQDGFAEFVFLEAGHRAVGQHDLPGALAELERVRTSHPQLDAQWRGQQAYLTLLCDRVPAADALKVRPGETDSSELLMLVQAACLIAQGQTEDAAEQLALVHPRQPRMMVHKRILEALVLVIGTGVEAGVELAIKRLWEAMVGLDAYSIPGYAYVASLGMCMLGRLDELESIVEIIYQLGDSSLFQSSYKAGLFMIGSFVADWGGRRQYARNLSLQAKALNVSTGPFPSMLASPELQAGSAAGRDRIWDDIDGLVDRGFVAAAVYLAVATAEIDLNHDRAAPLIDRGLASQSRVLRALTRYVAATVSRDLAGFPAVLAELRATCGPLDVTRAMITWALMLREAGDTDGWLEQADAAWREANAISRPVDGLFARLVDAVNLTIREAEVARFAIRGLSSAEIAAQLGLTARTVETYLHSVYRKSGVKNRTELRRITHTWLALRLDD